MKKVIISLLLGILMAVGLLFAAVCAGTAYSGMASVEQLADEYMMTLQSAPTPITSVSVTGVKTPVADDVCSVSNVKITTVPANAFVTTGEKAPYAY